MPEAQCRGAETRTALQGHRDPGMPAVLAQQGLGREGEQAPAPSMDWRRTPCNPAGVLLLQFILSQNPLIPVGSGG